MAMGGSWSQEDPAQLKHPAQTTGALKQEPKIHP